MKASYKDQLYFIILLIIFISLIFPLGGLILSFLYALNDNNRKSLYFFAFILILYVSFVNASKVISSDPDLPWYTAQYKMAGKMGYMEYIYWFGVNGKGRELFFPTFNYIVYFIAGDNVNLYRFIHSFVCYLLSLTAIIRMGLFMKQNNRQIIIPLVWFVCMPWIFTYSQTILRQFLASAFLMVIIVEHFFYKKKMILLSICMVLSHTSTFIFLPFLYIPFFRKPLTKTTFSLYALTMGGLVGIQLIVQHVGSLFASTGDNALTYVLDRASNDTTAELPPLSIGKILFLIIISSICLWTYHNKRIYKKVLLYKRLRHVGLINKKDLLYNSIGHVGLINTVVFFCFFILANLYQLELSNRLFSYASMLSAFPVIYLASKINPTKSSTQIYFYLMQVILILYFSNSTHFEYKIPYGILFLPLQYVV